MFPSAVIRKGSKLKGAKKVPETPFVKTKEVPSEDLEGAMELEQEKVPSAKSVPQSKVPSAKSINPEDTMSMDMMLKMAKKPSKANASSEEGEEFEVEKDEEGKWSESGVAKEKYLKAIGKLKKKK